jgi:hypothetical protein
MNKINPPVTIMTIDAAKDTIAKMRKIEPDGENENKTGPWVFYWPRGDKSTHYIDPDGWTYTVVPAGGEFYQHCLTGKTVRIAGESIDSNRAIIAIHDESMSYIGTL